MNLRKLLLIAIPIAALAVAAAAVVATRVGRDWTTDSKAAIEEFEAGLQDELKFYPREALEHFSRAAELDPDFLAPKVKLVRMSADKERRHDLIVDLKGRDLSRVTPRERLQVEYVLANIDRQPEKAEALLAAYLAEHPAEPFALELKCGQLWSKHQWPEAEVCYRRLIAADPNWVEAQNRLGYIFMAQGRFAEAEEQFEIYRYIAPDQPNPHDSLGELLLLLGRWREARNELEEALRIKPDFCASWANRVQLALFEGDYADADAVLARADDARGCPPADLAGLRCQVAAWRAFDAGRWDEVVATTKEPGCCGGHLGDVTVIAYEAALRAGRAEEAAAIADELSKMMAKYPEEHSPGAALQLYLAGIRLRLAGDPAAAAANLRQADEQLAYWKASLGYLKLAIRLELAQALTEAGRDAEAARVRAEVESVNPRLLERWRPAPVARVSAAGGVSGMLPAR